LSHLKSPNISTKRIVLRNLSESDALALFSIRSNATVNKYLLRKADVTVDDSAQHIKKILNLEKAGKVFYWAIQLENISALIGTICLFNLNENKTKAELGFELHPAHMGKGLISEAIEAVLSFALSNGIKTIEAHTDKKNEASKKVLGNAQFQLSSANIDEAGDLVFVRLLHLS